MASSDENSEGDEMLSVEEIMELMAAEGNEVRRRIEAEMQTSMAEMQQELQQMKNEARSYKAKWEETTAEGNEVRRQEQARMAEMQQELQQMRNEARSYKAKWEETKAVLGRAGELEYKNQVLTGVLNAVKADNQTHQEEIVMLKANVEKLSEDKMKLEKKFKGEIQKRKKGENEEGKHSSKPVGVTGETSSTAMTSTKTASISSFDILDTYHPVGSRSQVPSATNEASGVLRSSGRSRMSWALSEDSTSSELPPTNRPRARKSITFDEDSIRSGPEQVASKAASPRKSILLRASSKFLGRSKRKVQSTPPYAKVEVIESFLREEVGMKNEMTKTTFRKLLLDEGGIHVDDALLDAIFVSTDKDKSGLVDAGELATFIHEIKPTTKYKRRKFIALSCLLYPPFYLSFFCLNASLMSATTNLREREYGDLYGANHPFWAIASISDLIGLFGYVILKWEEERLKYENIEQAKFRLVRWVKVDLPRYMRRTALRKFQGGRITANGVEGVDEGKQHADEGVDEEQGMIGKRIKDLRKATGDVLKATGEHMSDGIKATGGHMSDGIKATADYVTEGLKAVKGRPSLEFDAEEAAATIRSLLYDSKNDLSEGPSASSRNNFSHDGLDLQELRLLLETMGVFLADHALQEVFREIDDDQSGSITIKELLEYATKNETLDRGGRCSKYAAILKRCCKTIGWWGSGCFLTGASFWVTLSFVQGKSYIELKSYLGLTCTFYLFGALSNISNLYRSTEVQVWQVNSANMMLRAAAITVGLSQMQNSKGVGNNKMGELDNSIQSRIRNDAIEKLETGDTSRKKVETRQEFLNVRASITRSSTNGSGNLNDSEQWQAYDAKTISAAQVRGAVALFQKIDVSNDDNVDEKELFDALVSLGVNIPTSAFSAIYKAIDIDGDGDLQMHEFIAYVSAIKPGMTKRQRRLSTLRYMVVQTAFYLILAQVFSGLVQTYASWVGSTRAVHGTKNLFLAGSFGWALGSLYFLFTWPKNKGVFFNQLENAKFMLKAAILDGCKAYFTSQQEETT